MSQSLSSLEIQAQIASEYLSEAWPLARLRAQESSELDREPIESILLCGCGDSHHAALSLEFALSTSTGRPTRASHSMGVARYLVDWAPAEPRRTLVVGISVSGEVARTLEAIEQARKAGFRTLAFTSQPDSSLASAAELSWGLPLPELDHGPGLISYMASLLMGYALAGALATPGPQEAIDRVMTELPGELSSWRERQEQQGHALAASISGRGPMLYIGSGPAYGSALFAAAKAIEAAGAVASGQDVEEWAHLEYFCEPPELPVWLLSGNGRSLSREREVQTAAQAIGRKLVESRWSGKPEWGADMCEASAPLALWVGPVAFADRLAQKLGERPFRGFEGGRSPEGGGGISRIRTSERLE